MLKDLISKLNSPESENEYNTTPQSDVRLNALADKTQMLSNRTSSMVERDESGVYHSWHEMHPTLLSIWDRLSTGHLFLSSDAGDVGGNNEPNWPNSMAANSWAIQHEGIESVIASIHSDPLFGSIHRKQMQDLPFQAVHMNAFDILSHAPPDLAY